MKRQQIARAALLALLVTACAGEKPEQQAAPTTVQLETIATTTVPVTQPVVVPPTTSPAPSAAAPSSLAFASTSDIGRLFEVTGTESTYVNADSDETKGQISPGTLVQATSARSRDNVLWVRVRETSGDQADLGWLRAGQLSSTSRFLVNDNPAQSGELRVVRRSGNPIAVVRLPGGTEQVRSIQSLEVAMHGGSEALGADGEQYLDVIDSASGTRLGWVPADSFLEIRSNLAQTQDHIAIRTRVDRSITYGAPLQTVSITEVGCNASQVTIVNPSIALGLAVVLGVEVPTGRLVNRQERWSAPSGGVLYINPGDIATLTFPTSVPRRWYFSELDEQLRAEAPRTGDGTLIGIDNGPVETTRSKLVEIPGGSCAYVAPTPDPLEADPLGLERSQTDVTQPAPPGTESTQTTDELTDTDSSVGTGETPSTTVTPYVQSTGQVAPVTGADDDLLGIGLIDN